MRVHLDNLIVPNQKTKGKKVRVKILIGPLENLEIEAKKITEEVNGNSVNLYYVEKDGIKTFFTQKDVIEL